MLAWSPLLVQKIEIHALGFVLRKLQLNRHREAEVAIHSHAFAQLVLYLSGEGLQSVNGRRHRARAGDLFVIPPRTPHGFSVVGRSRPLCVVVDYALEAAGRVRFAHRCLSPATLNELHGLLSQVPRKGRLTLGDYPAVLAVVARLLNPSPEKPSPAPSLFEKLRGRIDSPAPLGSISRELGYHPDHLCRKLKQEAGLGLRELRSRLRLESAQATLRSSGSVAEAATRCGFEDPNYFARWFRRQTGITPSVWRDRPRAGSA